MYFQKIKSTIDAYIVNLPEKTADVIVEVFFSAGYFHAPIGKGELPHLLEHYLFRCAEKAGLDAFGSTNVNRVSVYCIFDRNEIEEKLPKFLNLALRNQIADKEIFDKEKKILLNELTGIVNDPEELSYRAVLNTRLRNRKPFTIKTKEYETLSLSDLADYYRTHCNQEDVTVFIGAHQPDDSLQERLLKTLSPYQPTPATVRPALNLESSAFQIVQHELPHGRTELNVSWPSPNSLTKPKEQLAAALIHSLLVDAYDGLLWQTLRDGYGLSYGINGYNENYRELGLLCVSVAVLPADLEESLSIILRQVKRLRDGDYQNELLQKKLAAEMQASKDEWESNTGRFYWIATDTLERARNYSPEEWQGFYRDIDKKFISWMAHTYLKTENLNLVLIGDSFGNGELRRLEEIIKKNEG